MMELAKVCRLCNSDSGVLLNMFEPPLEIVAEIEDLIPNLNVHEYEYFPRLICHRCIAKVRTFKEFRETCFQICHSSMNDQKETLTNISFPKATVVKNQNVSDSGIVMKSNNVCRLCICDSGFCVKLFEPALEIIAQLKIIIPNLKIIPYDYLPSLIFHRCVGIVRDFHEFRNTCFQTERNLKELLRTEKNYKRIAVSSEINQGTSSMVFVPKNSVIGTPTMAAKIVASFNDDDIQLATKSVNTPNVKKWTPINASHSIAATVTKQVKIMPNIPIAKPSCFEIKEKHLFGHTGEKPHECTACGKHFRTVHRLKDHLVVHTGEKPYNCGECGRAFGRQGYLRLHLRIHTGEHPYVCSVCKKSFYCNSNFKRHLRVHTEEKSHECTECGKLFAQLSYLRSHLRVHTGEKPYKCTVCLKPFTRLQRLKEHVLRHTGGKPHNSGEHPYECTVCKMSFAFDSNLRRHLLVHTAEKSHKCTVCGKLFAQLRYLRLHLRVHTGEKPYKCTVCLKPLTRLRRLKEHVLRHTEEKPHKCTRCGMCFKLTESLKSHN